MTTHVVPAAVRVVAVLVPLTGASAVAELKPAPVSRLWLESKGARMEGPVGHELLWLDEATKARRPAGGRAASASEFEALTFHQPHDSTRGYFEKSYNDGPLWFSRMVFGNGWAPGDFISSYELVVFHSSSDDPAFGPADYAVELWDGDPLSILETVCTTGGVAAPIPGTQGILADVPYGTVVRGRVELPAKVQYDCDRVWMGMTSLNGCRAAWRLSGSAPGSAFDKSPSVGRGQGIGLITGCESSTFGGVCPTATGYGIGFCCGSTGTCSGSGDPCGFGWSDCPAGETCDGAEACDHGSASPSPDPCSSAAAATQTFCGDGFVSDFLASMDPTSEEGCVGSVFAAAKSRMEIVAVSIDAPPPAGGPLPADVLSFTPEEIVLTRGGHDIWLEIRVGDWDPDDIGYQLSGYSAAFDSSSLSSGELGTLELNTGGISCGECSDTSAPCFSHDDCTVGFCSGSADPCHVALTDCPSGQSCIGAALCVPSENGDEQCAAALGNGAACGPEGNYLGDGTCGFAYIDTQRADWVLAGAIVALPAVDVSRPDFRVGGAPVIGVVDDPEPFPADLLYGASFSVKVPADAKGTFTISLDVSHPAGMAIGDYGIVPLIAKVPARITIPTGRCCYNVQDILTGGGGCVDFFQTPSKCAQQPGYIVFTAGETCAAPCLAPDCASPSAPESDFLPDQSGNPAPSVKNRFISFSSSDAGTFQAARVTFVSLPRPFDLWNGRQLWVTEPREVSENASAVAPIPGTPNFFAATLTCAGPVFTNFADLGTIHVFHEGIIPEGTYRVELLDNFCSPDFEENYSPPLDITNPLWGDALGGFETIPPSVPEGQARVVDVLGILWRFSNVPGSISKARADMEPACLDLTINVSDAVAALTGFAGLSYPFAATASDPCQSTCLSPLP